MLNRLVVTGLSLVAIFFVVTSWPVFAQSTASPDCSNPRSAADSVFDWLRPQTWDPDKAGGCIDVPKSGRPDRLAVQLKQVLDARGLLVPISTLPTDPDYVDEDGRAVVSILPDDLPLITVVRQPDGRWTYSRDTAEAIPELYANTFSSVSLWFQNSGPPVFHTRVLGLYVWQYLYGFALLAVAALVGFLVRLLLRTQVSRLVERLGLPLDEKTYRRTNRPVVVAVTTGLLGFMLPDLHLPVQLARVLSKLLEVVSWTALFTLLFHLIQVAATIAAQRALRTESRLDDQAIPLIRQSAQAVLIIVAILVLSDTLGFDVWKLAAGVGVGSLAFALAAQDTVANLFGSLNIFLDRPFQIGEWVKIGEVEGVVEEVGFRSTRVRTFYNSLVTIPNSQITNANVDNLGLRPRRRIKHVVAVTYDTPADVLEAYAAGIRAILVAHPYVQNSFEVHVWNLGDSAIELLVYYHVVTPGWHEELETRAQNLLEFIRLADTMGVSFAFPSTSVYVEATPEHPLAEFPSPSLDELQATVDSFGPGGARSRPHGPAFPRTWAAQALPEAQDRGSASDDA
ncbi:MAG: mechanosensitive ion channel family protein [Myxococcota bacterium]